MNIDNYGLWNGIDFNPTYPPRLNVLLDEICKSVWAFGSAADMLTNRLLDSVAFIGWVFA